MFCTLHAHASTCAISSGASESTIQSILNSCGSGNTATFAAGTYLLSSMLQVPCGVSLAGPEVAWSNPSAYTATLSSSVTGDPAVVFSGCSTAASVHYLNCDGGRPSPDGGQCFFFPAGTSNMTLSYNHFYGIQGSVDSPNWYDSMVRFDGNASSSVSSNDTVAWNIFGNPSLGDCSNLMTNYTYAGLGGDGGYCNGLGIHNGMENLVVENNIFQFVEQGMKTFEATGECVNCTIAYNDFNNIHRINYETQADIGGSQPTSMYIFYNSVHDQFDTNFGSWGFSAANGCNSGCATETNYNVLINNNDATSAGGYTPGAIEVWGSNGTTDSYNLIQGYWANGIMTSTTGQFVYTGNNFCMSNGGSETTPGSGGYFNSETSNSLPYTATATANTFSRSNTCAQTSVAPVISPPSGSSSGSQTVTFTNPGQNRDKNTGIWYTTDGTNPVPGAGTAKYISSGGSITVVGTMTVKAVGMWGAANQPTSYAPGYGYVPSAVVSAVAIGNQSVPEKTVVSGYLRPKSGANTMTAGNTLQMTAYVTYSDGSTGTLPDAYGHVVTSWNTTNHAVAKISSLGHATALAAGSINMEAMIGALKLTQWTVKVGATAVPAAQPAATAAISASSAANVQAEVAAQPQASPGADSQAGAAPVTQTGLTALTPGPAPAAPAGPVADAFLGPFWMLVTPAGGSAAISNSHLFIGVPGGENHDPLVPSNQAVRVVQAIGDEDFDVAVKIDSPLVASDGNTSQGVMVLSGNGNFITYALTTNGTSIGLSARMVAGGVATKVLDDTDFSQYQNPMYLRVTKAGSAFVALYSLDGTNWTQAASFTDVTKFTSIGPFASNYNDTPANATPVVMSVNWFDVLQ
jgi:Chitobiase/beta-hexosaminidase C-terminal domain/Bacterial Ig-like domain (group 2)